MSVVVLTDIRNEVLAKVKGLSPSMLRYKKSEKEWSIIEILEHLFLMEQSVLKGITHALKDDNSPSSKEVPIHLTPLRERKVKAPSFVEPKGQIESLDELVQLLNGSREKLFSLVDDVPLETLQQKSFPHMVFGQVPLHQWILFIGYHEKRHLEQMDELLQYMREKNIS
ncbi:hypothetical protein Q73_08880 [Bacillus coahuilensis m2-6]|uniref:DinB family protein n=1 Tax=Bacillus coahuilensis TaxID=408580 RepID=UPI00075021AD|nr:DinB family protein [Bacillus coahuilensis]KUP07484.1 hypothetical protein Q73_08880 [Bacillus coahuilensis m2-6]